MVLTPVAGIPLACVVAVLKYRLFAARLKDAVDLDSVHNDLASVVHQVLEPAHVSIWSEKK
jgi:hypothetical protein